MKTQTDDSFFLKEGDLSAGASKRLYWAPELPVKCFSVCVCVRVSVRRFSPQRGGGGRRGRRGPLRLAPKGCLLAVRSLSSPLARASSPRGFQVKSDLERAIEGAGRDLAQRKRGRAARRPGLTAGARKLPRRPRAPAKRVGCAFSLVFVVGWSGGRYV